MRTESISLGFALFQLTFLMLGFALFIDSINGFFLAGMGIDPRLSAVYKFLFFIIVLYQVGCYSRRSMAGILLLLVTFMVGPTVTLVKTLDAAGYFTDLTMALKVLAPLNVFAFCVLSCQQNADLVLKYGKAAIWLSFFVLLGNLILGALGVGFASYGTGEIGIKGFFFASNELSGVFVTLFGVFLHHAWQKGKSFYALASLIAFVFGFMIATKAAMLSAAVLSFAIPIFNERNRIFHLSRLKLGMMLPIIIVISVLAVTIVQILEATGLWSRFVWLYDKKGALGLILSGRDKYVINAVDAVDHYSSLLTAVFGYGRSGLEVITQGTVEVDPIDMYFWFGIPGLAFFLFISTLFIRVSYLSTRLKQGYWGPTVLLTNITLIGISMIAGHTLTSGMLGPLLGLINGLAFADWKLAQRNHQATQVTVA